MDKLTEHINAFKVSKSTKESIIKIAEDEELLIHNVIRKLIRIGLKNYHIVDSNEMLKKNKQNQMKKTAEKTKQKLDFIENKNSLTAVEWLIEQLNLVEWIEDDGMPDIQLEILRQAIEMEIRQIQDACFESLKNQIIEIKEISDEEIEKESNRYLGEENRFCFKSGAKWYREQLKSKI